MRRLILYAIIVVLCGFLTTISVSWVSAYWIENQSFTFGGIDKSEWTRNVPDTWPVITDSPTILYSFTYAETYWQTNQHSSKNMSYTFYDHRFGWPYKAMSYQIAIELNMASGEKELNLGWLSNGIRLRPYSHHDQRLPTRLELVPFTLNTLIFSAIYLALLICISGLAHYIKSHKRTRHDRCSSCGYDITNLKTCPECGTPADPRTMVQ